MTDLQSFENAVDGSWYEIEFEVTRWVCPKGLPTELRVEIMEALEPIDHVLFNAVETVNSFTHGLPDDPRRYVPESLLESLKADLADLDDRLVLVKSELANHWPALLQRHAVVVRSLTPSQQVAFTDPAGIYLMTFKETQVTLPQGTRHLLEGTYNPPNIEAPESHQGIPWPDFESPQLPARTANPNTTFAALPLG